MKKERSRKAKRKTGEFGLSGVGVFSVVLAALVMVVSIPAYLVFRKPDQTQAAATARSLPIYSVETEEKKVAISFDCAWGVEYTDKIGRAHV